jgi:hypothetical protein
MPGQNFLIRAEAAAGLANPVQDTQNIDILLVTVFATIARISAPGSASSGENISVGVVMMNTGTGAGYLWAQLIDRDNNQVVGPKTTTPNPINPGEEYGIGFQLTMPNKTWKLRAEAGH